MDRGALALALSLTFALVLTLTLEFPSGWLSLPLGGVGGGFLGDYQDRIWGLTEAFLWIQLVAEGSLSKRRALGVSITKARYIFVEGSAFQ